MVSLFCMVKKCIIKNPHFWCEEKGKLKLMPEMPIEGFTSFGLEDAKKEAIEISDTESIVQYFLERGNKNIEFIPNNMYDLKCMVEIKIPESSPTAYIVKILEVDPLEAEKLAMAYFNYKMDNAEGFDLAPGWKTRFIEIYDFLNKTKDN